MSTPGFVPARVLSLELTTGALDSVSGAPTVEGYERALVLVRLHGDPMGLVAVAGGDNETVVANARRVAWRDLAASITAHVREDGLEEPRSAEDLAGIDELCPRDREAADGPHATVVIPSLRNVDATVECVKRILEGSYPNFDVLVVDNDSDGGPLSAAVNAAFKGETRVRYVHEPQQGVSRARNRGLAEAQGELVVFTDDDVHVDRRWLERIVSAFEAEPGVACVTGAILPAELETPAQEWLEQFGGFNKGFERQFFNLTTHSRPEPLYPFDAGRFGSGANSAFRADVFRNMGGFAVDLGAGTPTYSGEDIDVLRRVVSEGHTLVYEPGALLWHFHRRSYEALRRQMYRYGVGLSATATKWMMEDRATAIDVLRRLPAGVRHVLAPSSKKNARKSRSYPRSLSALELMGLAVGPMAYVRSRRQVRKAGREGR